MLWKDLLDEFYEKLKESQEDIPPEFQKLIDKGDVTDEDYS